MVRALRTRARADSTASQRVRGTISRLLLPELLTSPAICLRLPQEAWKARRAGPRKMLCFSGEASALS